MLKYQNKEEPTGLFRGFDCNNLECQKYIKILSDDLYSKKKGMPLFLNLQLYNDFSHYLRRIKKAKYHYKKALNNNCWFSIFNCEDFKDNIIEIRQSKLIRTGGIVPFFFSDTYFCRKKVYYCNKHWEKYFGIFKKNKLVGYTKVRRVGNIVKLIEFLGHSKYLSFNIMDLLWMELVKITLKQDQKDFKGIEYIYYGCAEHGSIGLVKWKKKYAFEIYKI